MQNDLISRRDARQSIALAITDVLATCKTEALGNYVLKIQRKINNEVNRVPTISPESLRERGRWEKSRYNGFLWCSVCKNCYVDDHWPNDEKWKFCPSCGARMELEG